VEQLKQRPSDISNRWFGVGTAQRLMAVRMTEVRGLDEIGAVVAGAGVVGLAVARALALAGREVLVLERESHFGTITSSRNSEVIHAGIYYPPGSLKAELCVEGKERLYAFCTERGVSHRRCGKLIFAASDSQRSVLDEISRHADDAAVIDLVRLDSSAARRLEPALACVEALLSPSTGIIDSHAYMQALLGEATSQGAMLVCGAAVDGAALVGDQWVVRAGDVQLATPIFVNSAGLDAPALARRIDGLATRHVPQTYLAKGCYFTYSGKTPFRRLIYPVPELGGLGTHLTLDLAGQARFGPDVAWVDKVDYSVDPALKPKFLSAARRIWPDIDPDKLLPGYAGVRPKLAGPGEPAADFILQGPTSHGLPGLVNLFGIESPGLTASLAIADRVARALEAF
jgi:L-2-hydroxyglutarate oxidase LhgO